MLERVDRFIRENHLLTPGDRLLVAVSGGPDSVCLLHIMHRLSTNWGFSLVVAHLDHGLRGSASQGDALFVQRLAAQWGWPAVIERRDIKCIIKEQGGSVQDVCRQQRFAFLRQAAQAHKVNAILLAHHGGDQAETLLLHLLRGAGSSGLKAMAPRDEALGGIAYVRPLLRESKASILAYLRQQQLGYRVDASNATLDYTRNRVRLEIMPLLAAFNPEVELALVRSADLLYAEDLYLDQLATEALAQCWSLQHDPWALDVAQLQGYSLAIRRRVLRLLWQQISGGPQDLSYTHVEDALGLLGRDVGTRISWPYGWQVRRSYNALVWERVEQEKAAIAVPLPLPGEAILPQGAIRASILSSRQFSGFDPDPRVAYCDLDSLAATELTVRYWQPGDSFYPLGLKGSKKLQDFFTDVKVDQGKRGQIPLVVRGQDIVWIAGYRLDDRWRVSDKTRKLLRLQYVNTIEGER